MAPRFLEEPFFIIPLPRPNSSHFFRKIPFLATSMSHSEPNGICTFFMDLIPPAKCSSSQRGRAFRCQIALPRFGGVLSASKMLFLAARKGISSPKCSPSFRPSAFRQQTAVPHFLIIFSSEIVEFHVFIWKSRKNVLSLQRIFI